MELQTKIPLRPEEKRIDYDSVILLLGSCFTEKVGEKLAYYKFKTVQNPFGVIFHPLALETLMQRAIDEQEFAEEDLISHNGLWHSLLAHSDLSSAKIETALGNLNSALRQLHTAMIEASHVVLTFGTAWAYRYRAEAKFVANCHKIPQKNFEKELLSVTQISKSLANMVELITKCNRNAVIVTTVSPVRHIKDGFVENTRSKAHLITAIHQTEHPRLAYFPSYELMMDELRDYRFYAGDMLHPNQTAIDYIWEKFASVWIDPSTASLQKEIDVIQKGLRHRPFQEESEQHQEFLTQLQKKIERIRERLPRVAF
jgi:hypothetical protein